MVDNIESTDSTVTPPDAAPALTDEQRDALAARGITLPGQPTPLRAIDRIAAAFAQKSWSIAVPEWDGIVIYFTPLTTTDVEIVEANLAEVASAHERNVRMLIHKARGEDGKPLFAPGDILTLKNQARWDVVNRVTAFMYRCGSLSPTEAKDALGNASSSATTSSSPSVSA